MKYFFAFSCAECLAVLLGFINRPFAKIEWMSRDYTKTLKGASMLTVLWSHVGLYYGVRGIQFIGSVGLSLFIMFSGYGLQISVQKNGLKSFWIRRMKGVVLPYWIAEGIGLLAIGRFTIKRYLQTIAFIRPAMGPEWFMQYIMISYLIFFVVKYVISKKESWSEELLLYGGFLIWLVVDSVFFADPAMPFLKARQMLCFPFGVSLAKNRISYEKVIRKPTVALAGGGIGLGFMGITQLSAVKAMPFLVQNTLSLFTLFPLALAVLSVTNRWKCLINNSFFKWIGEISFELYLVHMFTLSLLKQSLLSFLAFVMITFGGAWLYHTIIIKGKKLWQT